MKSTTTTDTTGGARAARQQLQAIAKMEAELEKLKKESAVTFRSEALKVFQDAVEIVEAIPEADRPAMYGEVEFKNILECLGLQVKARKKRGSGQKWLVSLTEADTQKILEVLPHKTRPSSDWMMVKDVAKVLGSEDNPTFGGKLATLKQKGLADFKRDGTKKLWFKL
jgi:hypothetical protein